MMASSVSIRLHVYLRIGISVLCLMQGILGEWDCVDTDAQRYSGSVSLACPKATYDYRNDGCRPCLRWEDMTSKKYNPIDYPDADLIENYCRVVGTQDGPRCYYLDHENKTKITYCRIPACKAHSGCVKDDDGSAYRDAAMFTQSGYSCQLWQDMMDQPVNPVTYPHAGLESNFCRNPNNASSPWCYYRTTNNTIAWDFCPIERCKSDALSKFTRRLWTYIESHNKKYHKVPGMTAEDCAEYCLAEDSFVCRSFEFREEYWYDDRRCILTDQSLYTLDLYRNPAQGIAIDLFTRIDTDDCPLTLGMQDNRIPPSDVTASSEADDQHTANHGRLNSESYWKPVTNGTGEWFQVCFPRRMVITGVVTQGGGTEENQGWVEYFKLHYRTDSKNWWIYRDYEPPDPKDVQFRANGETTCSKPIIFPYPIHAECIKIIPTGWFNSIHLRLELIGCEDNDCDNAIGVSSHNIWDDHFHVAASSSLDDINSAQSARLSPIGRAGTGWIPKVHNQNQWIQVDLEFLHTVHTVATQGCSNVEYWVTSFTVSYENDDEDGPINIQSESGLSKVFDGNKNRESVIRNTFNPPITARIVRLHPVTWHDGVCLRLEFVGCLYQTCVRRLGMESDEIRNNQITSSSNFYTMPPYNGRLHYKSDTKKSCWGPRHELGQEEWLQIDLLHIHTITAVITQGGGDDWRHHWVTTYKVHYASRGKDKWLTYRNLDGTIKIFDGNTDQTTEVRNDLDRPVITSKVRISPHSWHNLTACLRVELVGCPLQGTGNICGYGHSIDYDGYCYGTVNSATRGACDTIFAEGSSLAIVNSARTQSNLKENMETLNIEYRQQYKIGLAYNGTTGETDFKWNDGTPLTYNNFRWIPDIEDIFGEYCVSIDMGDSSRWREYECDQTDVQQASLCQIDFDECLTDSHKCSHSCHNTPGSYYCGCPQGFILDPNQQGQCIDICEIAGDHFGSEVGWLRADSKCIIIFDNEVSHNQALQQCGIYPESSTVVASNITSILPLLSQTGLFNSYSNLWISGLRTENDEDRFSDETDGKCIVLSTDNATLELHAMDCNTTLPSICSKGLTNIDIPVLWAAGQNSTETIFTQGYIQSLSFGPWYHADSTCTIKFKVPDGLVLRITIHKMNLRQHTQSSKCLDTLDIYDITDLEEQVLRGSYCGERYGFEVVTRSNNVMMMYRIAELSEDMPKELGFVAEYAAIDCSVEECDFDCGATGILSNSEGTFYSKNYPSILPPFSACKWTITVPEGNFIRLEFKDFQIRRDEVSKNCTDYILLQERGQDSFERERQICGRAPPLFLSSTSELQVIYKTGLDVKSVGFNAAYETSDVGGCGLGSYTCSGIQHCRISNAIITSVNYPIRYHPNSRCKWHIRTGSATYVSLTFKHFDVPARPGCTDDRVRVFDGSTEHDDALLGTFCNRHRPNKDVLASFNEMTVTFDTDDVNEGAGFQAEYHTRTFEPRVAVQPSIAVEYNCPELWDQYKQFCFRFEAGNDTIRWTDAQKTCSDLGGYLASIKDYKEMRFVHKKLTTDWFTGDLNTYIGLNDAVAGEGHYRWVDSSPMSYADWSVPNRQNTLLKPQPDGDVLEGCSVIKLASLHSTNNWHDVSCASMEAKQFICKKPGVNQDGETYNQSTQSIGSINKIGCMDDSVIVEGLCLNLLYTNVSVIDGKLKDLSTCSYSQETFTWTDPMLSTIGYFLQHLWNVPGVEGYKVLLNKRAAFIDDKAEIMCDFLKFMNGNWSSVSEVCQWDSIDFPAKICVHTPIDYLMQCSSRYFTCTSGECIQSTYECDGVDDCRDGSDEFNCPQDKCGDISFECTEGGCISSSFYCDFVPHCPAGSDEKQCVYPKCTKDEFACNNGQCVSMDKRCDLANDCIDGSDENLCGHCSGGFQCHDGRCLPLHAVCDATKDCPGNSWEDEPLSCSYHQPGFTCDDNQIQCSNGACADRKYLCLYDFDEYGLQRGCRDVTHLRYCESFTCGSLTFKCPESYCIPLRRRCDDVIDCPGGEDEQECGNFNCEGAHRCHGTNYCVTSERICDGAKDCIEGDDELYCHIQCPSSCNCTGLVFACDSDSWSSAAASRIPANIRMLTLNKMSQTPIRYRRDVNNMTTIETVMLVDLLQFPYLLVMNVASNGITTLIPGMFKDLRNLQTLDISFNQIQTLEGDTFMGLQSLRNLHIQGNPLVTLQPAAFRYLVFLPKLNISNLQLTELKRHSFVGMPSLKYLYIENNQISSIESRAFEGLNGTEVLNLQGNDMHMVNEDMFLGLNSLRNLSTDKYLFCCVIGEIEHCEPEPDQFSSCSDLIRNTVLRTFMWLLGLSAFVGNIFVIAWRVKAKERFRVQGLLILNLAVSDCLMGIYMIIIAGADVHFRDVYIYHSEQWKNGLMCGIAGFLSVLSSEASVYTLTVISLDRFICIMFPFSHRRITRRSAPYIIAAGWIISMLLSLIPAMPFLSYFGDGFYGRSSVCLALPLTQERTPGWEYSVAVFLALNCVSFVIILLCYICIYVVAKRSSAKVRSSNKGVGKEIKLATKTMLIVATDMFCWLPIVLMGILSLTGAVVIPPTVYAWTAVFILPINSSLNPYLYTISSLELKGKISEISSYSKRTSSCPQCRHRGSTGKSDVSYSMEANKPAVVSHTTQTYTSSADTKTAPAHGRFILSHLKEDIHNFVLNMSDFENIETDLKHTLTKLHESRLYHGNITEDYIILEKQNVCDNWHGFLILPHKSVTYRSSEDEEKEVVLADEIDSMILDDIQQLRRILDGLITLTNKCDAYANNYSSDQMENGYNNYVEYTQV